MGGRIGTKGSFAYKYLPSSTVGVGLGSGTMAAASADEGNKLNAFITGGLAAGIGFGAFRGMGTLGKRLFSPWMRRGNISRYKNMGFSDDASKVLLRKNEFNYLDDMLSHTGGHVGSLKNYVGSAQFNLLNKSQQNLISKYLREAAGNKGYLSEEAIKDIGRFKNIYASKAKDVLSNTSGMTKLKYNIGTKAKYIGAVGGGLGISSATHEPLNNLINNTAGQMVPKSKQTPSNIYNPYYGGM